MLKQLLYRTYPYTPLSEGQLQALFSAFRKMIAYYPAIYYWTHRLDSERFLIMDFHHPSMLKYRGLEVVLIDGHEVAYYRLPGARAGGTGHVPAGVYQISMRALSGREYQVDLKKNHLGRCILNEAVVAPIGPQIECYPRISPHWLEPSRFADEMKTSVTRGMEWLYQSHRHAPTHRKMEIMAGFRHAELASAVAGISPEIDALLWMLNQPNT